MVETFAETSDFTWIFTAWNPYFQWMAQADFFGIIKRTCDEETHGESISHTLHGNHSLWLSNRCTLYCCHIIRKPAWRRSQVMRQSDDALRMRKPRWPVFCHGLSKSVFFASIYFSCAATASQCSWLICHLLCVSCMGFSLEVKLRILGFFVICPGKLNEPSSAIAGHYLWRL